VYQTYHEKERIFVRKEEKKKWAKKKSKKEIFGEKVLCLVSLLAGPGRDLQWGKKIGFGVLG